MGCDIHAHLEIKIEGKWEHYSLLRIERNYRLFTRMAGVRRITDDVDAISGPRGLPDDISVVTRLDAVRGAQDWHNQSWLTREELGELREWARRDGVVEGGNYWWWHDNFGFLFGDTSPLDAERMAEIGISDVRLVFWFDN
jgi:hypothetical protein